MVHRHVSATTTSQPPKTYTPVALHLKGSVARDEAVQLGAVAQRARHQEVRQEAGKGKALLLKQRQLAIVALYAQVICACSSSSSSTWLEHCVHLVLGIEGTCHVCACQMDCQLLDKDQSTACCMHVQDSMERGWHLGFAQSHGV